MRTGAMRLPPPARCVSFNANVSKIRICCLRCGLPVFRGLARGSCYSPRPHQRVIAARAKPVKVQSAAHVAHPSMTHRVSQDETLWDLAMRYGVTMKSIRAVNSIPEHTHVIVPGQVLVLPIQALDKNAPESWAEDVSVPKHSSMASSKDWLWTGKDSAVKHTSTVELANLIDPPEGTHPPNHDTVVVAYMPDCKHCQDLEPVIDKVSKGLQHEPSLKFLALRCQSQDSNVFAKDVLGARSFPTIVTYTQDGSLYRLRPKGNTVKGILAFINDTVRMEQDAPFELLAPKPVIQSATPGMPPFPPIPAASGAAVAGAVAGGACLLLLHHRGVLSSMWQSLKQQLQGPATQSLEDASALALDAASGHLSGTDNAIPSVQQVESIACAMESSNVTASTVDPDTVNEAETATKLEAPNTQENAALESSDRVDSSVEQHADRKGVLGSLDIGAKVKSFLGTVSTGSRIEEDSAPDKYPNIPESHESGVDVEAAKESEVQEAVERTNGTEERTEGKEDPEQRTVLGTSTAVASGILKIMDMPSVGKSSDSTRTPEAIGTLETVNISNSRGTTTDNPAPTQSFKTLDLSSQNQKSDSCMPKYIPVPLNEHAHPPGHDQQLAAVAAATGAVAASAAPIGIASVDATNSAVKLSASGSANDAQNAPHPGEVDRTVDITGRGPRPALHQSTDDEEESGRDVPRPRMVRMSVHESPDWDKIDDYRVLEAWTASGGDVREMATILSRTNGSDGPSGSNTAGAPKDMRGALKALKRALKRSTDDSTDELAGLTSKRP